MERLAGCLLLTFAVLLVVFGTGSGGLAGSRLGAALHVPRWVDTVVNWAIGLLSGWFGLALIFGGVHF